MNDEPSMLKTLFWIAFIPVTIVGVMIPRKPDESWLSRAFKIGIATVVVYVMLFVGLALISA